jgi:tyrosine-protein phosphatase SIW14
MKKAFFLSSVTLWLCVSAGIAAAAVNTAGVPNFQKVNDSVYRGAQPTEEGFKNLAAMGVKTVVDLREPGEHSQAREEAWVKADGMRYVSVPLRGMSAPPDGEVQKVLGILNDPSAGPVFMHCRRGADRTGTMVACYRISHDHWTTRNALNEARTLGMHFYEWAMQDYVTKFGAMELTGSASAR